MMTIRRYTASWCGPCKTYGPLFDEVANDPKFSLIQFETIDVDEEPEVATVHAVSNIPRTDILMEGVVIKSMTGVMDRGELEAFITTTLGEMGVSL